MWVSREGGTLTPPAHLELPLGICSGQATLVSMGVLEAGLWHDVWHWDVGLALAAYASPGGILCHADSGQRRAFINGSGTEMSNPDTAAGG